MVQYKQELNLVAYDGKAIAYVGILAQLVSLLINPINSLKS